MGEELDHAPSRELLRQLRNRVQEGASLSEAMAKFPKAFNVLYTKMVAAGEIGGHDDEKFFAFAGGEVHLRS